MKFKSMTTVNNNYAVLATRKEHYHELCYDRKLDDTKTNRQLLGTHHALVLLGNSFLMGSTRKVLFFYLVL